MAELVTPVRRIAVPALIAIAILFIAIRILTLPRTIWELDEVQFAAAVTRFEPLLHHPHPPGYPLLAILGKVFAIVFRDPFVSLVALSFVSCAIGFAALIAAFERITTDTTTALTGALLFFLSPAMLVHGSLALSDPPALMFLALALWSATRLDESPRLRDAIAFGVFCSASIGCRPQYLIPVLPLFVWVLGRLVVRLRSDEADHPVRRAWRLAAGAFDGFVVCSLVWFAFLVVALGGVTQLMSWEGEQASYVARHDALLSRSGHSLVSLVLRFVAHPWGPKWLSFPILALAIAGFYRFARSRNDRVIPIVIVAAFHLTFSILVTDPADAVRYALPGVLAVALLAAEGLSFGPAGIRWRVIAIAGVGAAYFVTPVVGTRLMTASPPVQAIAEIRRLMPKGSVVLFDQSLKPHVEVLLPEYTSMQIDRGLHQYARAAATPVIQIVDGGSTTSGARSFFWPDSDAYGKLTRKHYRVVTLIPCPPRKRFIPLRGTWPVERTPDGLEWRWLAPDASVVLPPYARNQVRVVLGLPPQSSIESNTVSIESDGVALDSVEVHRGKHTSVVLTLPHDGEQTLRFVSTSGYVPRESGTALDARKLGVQLIDLEMPGVQ